MRIAMDSHPKRGRVGSNIHWSHYVGKITGPVATVSVHCDDDISLCFRQALSSSDSIPFVGLKDYPRAFLRSYFSGAVMRPVINNYYFGFGKSVKWNLVQDLTNAVLFIKCRNNYWNPHPRPPSSPICRGG